MEELQQLTQKVAALEARLNALGSDSTVPLNVENALRNRLGALTTSAKGAETVTTSIGGGDVVAAPMNGFYQAFPGFFVPYYT